MFEPEPPLRTPRLVEHSLFVKAVFSGIQFEAEETRPHSTATESFKTYGVVGLKNDPD
jgi:hypothetical protein